MNPWTTEDADAQSLSDRTGLFHRTIGVLEWFSGSFSPVLLPNLFSFRRWSAQSARRTWEETAETFSNEGYYWKRFRTRFEGLYSWTNLQDRNGWKCVESKEWCPTIEAKTKGHQQNKDLGGSLKFTSLWTSGFLRDAAILSIRFPLQAAVLLIQFSMLAKGYKERWARKPLAIGGRKDKPSHWASTSPWWKGVQSKALPKSKYTWNITWHWFLPTSWN